MKSTIYDVKEKCESNSERLVSTIIRQIITAWIIKELSTPPQMMPTPNFRRRHLK